MEPVQGSYVQHTLAQVQTWRVGARRSLGACVVCPALAPPPSAAQCVGPDPGLRPGCSDVRPLLVTLTSGRRALAGGPWVGVVAVPLDWLTSIVQSLRLLWAQRLPKHSSCCPFKICHLCCSLVLRYLALGPHVPVREALCLSGLFTHFSQLFPPPFFLMSELELSRPHLVLTRL